MVPSAAFHAYRYEFHEDRKTVPLSYAGDVPTPPKSPPGPMLLRHTSAPVSTLIAFMFALLKSKPKQAAKTRPSATAADAAPHTQPKPARRLTSFPATAIS